jgi:cellulose synthase/poly-beta-1,6-N-acetylglucosamine synthase-like glycosyltransferase
MAGNTFLVVFYAATCIQILFLIWVLWVQKDWKRKPFVPPPTPPPCSVIICARNESANLKQHLPQILAQDYAGTWEVLVVDDASSDDTPDVLRSAADQYPRLRHIRLSEKVLPGKKPALFAGIEVARYDHLVLTDADCSPAESAWLSKTMNCFASKPGIEIVLGYGPLTKQPGWLNAWSRFETAHTALLYSSLARAGQPYMGVGRNLAYTRAVFNRTNGFKKHMDLASGDDDLLVNEAANATNVALSLDSDAFMYSAAKATWKGWFQQKRRHLSAGTRYKIGHRLILGVLAGTHALHYGLLVIFLIGGCINWVLAGAYLLRTGFVWLAYGPVFKDFHESGLRWRLVGLDAMLAGYYGLWMPWVYLSGGLEKSTWK